ncbi:MAG: DUF6020 family protein [Lachnospiraceae bacterium]|nr:DUF6020 family protein [Lachnospiraceae bacterium]
MKDKRKIITYVLQIFLAFAASLAMAMISRYGITGIELMIPCVFALCLIVYIKVGRLIETGVSSKKDLRFSLPIGIIMAVAAVVGSHIDMDEKVFEAVGLADIVYIFFLIPFFTSVIQLLFFQSDAWEKTAVTGVKASHAVTDEKECKKSGRVKRYFLRVLVMLICWLPYYLTYFPGGIGSDDFECARMCLGIIPLTNHHPVFFTFILNIFISIARVCFGNSLTAAFAMMAFVQMVTLALTLSAVISWLERKGVGRAALLLSLCFFALHPIVAMYSIYVTKDVLFAQVVVLLTLFLADFVSLYGGGQVPAKDSRLHFTVLFLLSLMTILTRNNGTMIIAVLAIVMILTFRRYWKGLLLVFGLCFTLNALYKGPMWDAVEIEKQSFVEAASIPLSQIAYTIQNDGVIDEEDREYLESIMPCEAVKAEYEPGYTDSYKFSENFDATVVDEDPGKFIKVWAHMLPHNFSRYVEVYLMQTSGYWYYGMTNTVATEGVQPNDLGMTGIDVVKNITGHSLKSVLSELVLIARKLPILCMLSQMGIEILAVFLTGILFIRRKRMLMCVMLIPLIALWLSVMIATPAYCLFRYMCPVFFMWPILLCHFRYRMLQ